MYPYHNKIKQRIKNGELTDFMFVENYKNIGNCLLLFFNTLPFVRPIRPHKYCDYVDVLGDWKRKNGGTQKMYCKKNIKLDCDGCGCCASEEGIKDFCYRCGRGIFSDEKYSEHDGVIYCEYCEAEMEE